MDGNIPGGSFLGGNFPGGNFPGGSLMGANFPGRNFPRTPINYWKRYKKLLLEFHKVSYLGLSSFNIFLNDLLLINLRSFF